MESSPALADWWPVLLIVGGAPIIVTNVFRRKAGAAGRRSAPRRFGSTSAPGERVAMSNATQDFGRQRVGDFGGVEPDLRKASIGRPPRCDFSR
jgi:hypothetical protein